MRTERSRSLPVGVNVSGNLLHSSRVNFLDFMSDDKLDMPIVQLRNENLLHIIMCLVLVSPLLHSVGMRPGFVKHQNRGRQQRVPGELALAGLARG